MKGTGVRKWVAAAELTGLSQAERISVLRSRMSALAGPAPTTDPAVIAVPAPLSPLLPGGGLARRSVTQISDCPALIVELIAHCTAGGGHVAVVGWPELSFAGVVDSGGELARIITVPDPGPEPLGVTAVLVEGMDLVIHHGQGELSPARARPLLGKLRGGGAALLLVGTRVPAPVAVIDARVSTYRGAGAGTGRISGVDIAVTVRGAGGPAAGTTFSLGQRPRLRAV